MSTSIVTIYNIFQDENDDRMRVDECITLTNVETFTMSDDVKMHNLFTNNYETEISKYLGCVFESRDIEGDIDKWTDGTTVAITIDDYLVVADMDNNLTSFRTPPEEVEEIYNQVYCAIAVYSERSARVKKIPFCEQWKADRLKEVRTHNKSTTEIAVNVIVSKVISEVTSFMKTSPPDSNALIGKLKAIYGILEEKNDYMVSKTLGEVISFMKASKRDPSQLINNITDIVKGCFDKNEHHSLIHITSKLLEIGN